MSDAGRPASRILQGSFLGGLPRFGAGPSPPPRPHGRGQAFPLPAQLALETVRSPGRPLPDGPRRELEALFGADFSAVRIHQGDEALRMGAAAFTRGDSIFFAPGRFAPATAPGRRLLAHELTHVLQQRSGRVAPIPRGGLAVVVDPQLEREAEAMAARAVRPPAPAPPAPRPGRPRPSAASGGAAGAAQPFGLWLAGKVISWQRYYELKDRRQAALDLYQRLPRHLREQPGLKAQHRWLRDLDPWQVTTRDQVSTLGEINDRYGDFEEALRIHGEVTEARSYFERTGTALYRERRASYPSGMDRTLFGQLTALHRDLPNVKKRARRGDRQALGSLVQYLFNRFVGFGFGYQIMSGGPMSLLDRDYRPDTPEGNCIAYARAFADLLQSFGIEAYARAVRREDQGRFVVHLTRFIDSRVQGHIYDGGLVPGYYVFTSHAATWVPLAGKYFDPMAVASYASLDPYIDCELDDVTATVFRPKGRPRSLQPHRDWQLRLTSTTVTGGFHRLDLEDVG